MNETTKEVLISLATGGMIMVAATSPYFLMNVAKVYLKSRKLRSKKEHARKIAKAFDSLRRNDLVILKEENGEFVVQLTEKGKKRIAKIQFENMEIKKPKIWDKKWRVVIFDIPDKKKKGAREALREKLKHLNFYPLQKSVWVHCYPCEEEIQFLAELFHITPYVNIIIGEKIHNNIKLKAHFNLL